jgi:hypothetical protein
MRRRVLLFAALVAALSFAVPAGARVSPKCFGAAAREPGHPCENPRLRRTVVPTPDRAPLIPNITCDKQRITDAMATCAFGVPERDAVETVALIGDSHAQHWRPAVGIVARHRRWRVLDITVPHCLLTTTPSGIGPPFPTLCPQWDADVIAWLTAHPEIRTVILSGNAVQPITAPAGASRYLARVQGLAERLPELPPSVTSLIVIRDSPRLRLTTHDCVRHAMIRRKPAGRRCALPRRFALPRDPLVGAARLQTSRHVSVVDLSEHFCNASVCFPVVGGVLVHRDTDGHLSKLFARTLGPFLARAIDAFGPRGQDAGAPL